MKISEDMDRFAFEILVLVSKQLAKDGNGEGSPLGMISPSKKRPFPRGRRLFWGVMRRHNFSTTLLATMMGMDHSSVVRACQGAGPTEKIQVDAIMKDCEKLKKPEMPGKWAYPKQERVGVNGICPNCNLDGYVFWDREKPGQNIRFCARCDHEWVQKRGSKHIMAVPASAALKSAGSGRDSNASLGSIGPATRAPGQSTSGSGPMHATG